MAASGKILYSIVESPLHPDFTALYQRLGFTVLRPASQREAIRRLKRQPPAVMVADFLYGYGNNYAGANLGNLDVLLASLQRYAAQCRVIVLAQRDEWSYLQRLGERFALHACLAYPLDEAQLAEVLAPLAGAGGA
ncbi:hypothetical protein QVG61_09900 [Thiohalobacter sp. IOR34]|uniref:hypothetical protein n=1 Tax=Thiohalobacter sp. IOR34 TaxID=3057176 RepID=UPI0025B19EF2|nr:hypothetical protein [Thiohalobacter sp. IOR34]WJW74810.1 hypothetical protein QVG61_09900 [Thiohalobacter sp. IOR34]